jgi:hypothetical protein
MALAISAVCVVGRIASKEANISSILAGGSRRGASSGVATFTITCRGTSQGLYRVRVRCAWDRDRRRARAQRFLGFARPVSFDKQRQPHLAWTSFDKVTRGARRLSRRFRPALRRPRAFTQRGRPCLCMYSTRTAVCGRRPVGISAAKEGNLFPGNLRTRNRPRVSTYPNRGLGP